MKGRKPFGSRIRKAFVIATAALGLGASTGIIENLDKNPTTDTQNVTTFQVGTPDQHGYNISPLDQMWKHTLSLKSEAQRSADLFAAAQNGDSWRVQALIEHGINVNDEGQLALNDAIRSHSADVVGVLLKGGVSAAGVGGIEPLETAVVVDDVNIARMLLENGATPSTDALNYVALTGQTSMASLFLEYGADATASNSMALRTAAMAGNLQIVQLLVEAGADPAAKGNQALIDASSWGHTSVVQYLLGTTKTFTVSDDGFDLVRVPADSAFSLLPSNTLTYKAVDVHAGDDIALLAAASGDYTDTVQALINGGANPNAVNGEPLASAVFNGNTDLVQFLLDHGANVDEGNGKALNMAVMMNNVSMTRMLVDAGASTTVNSQTADMVRNSTNADLKEAFGAPTRPVKPSGRDFGI